MSEVTIHNSAELVEALENGSASVRVRRVSRYEYTNIVNDYAAGSRTAIVIPEAPQWRILLGRVFVSVYREEPARGCFLPVDLSLRTRRSINRVLRKVMAKNGYRHLSDLPSYKTPFELVEEDFAESVFKQTVASQTQKWSEVQADKDFGLHFCTMVNERKARIDRDAHMEVERSPGVWRSVAEGRLYRERILLFLNQRDLEAEIAWMKSFAEK